MKTKEELEDELGDWHATFPDKTASQVCELWGETQRERDALKESLHRSSKDIVRLEDEVDALKAQLEQAHKACAEMSDSLSRVVEDGLVTNMPEWQHRAKEALGRTKAYES